LNPRTDGVSEHAAKAYFPADVGRMAAPRADWLTLLRGARRPGGDRKLKTGARGIEVDPK
jgi:hypothetical protein